MTLRVLHLVPTANPAYGGPLEGIRQFNRICSAELRKVQAEVATLDSANQYSLDDLGVPTHALGWVNNQPGGLARILNHYRYSPLYAPWLRDNVHRFHLVLVHGLWNYVSFAAAEVLPHCSTPYYVFCHGMLDPYFRRRSPVKDFVKQAMWPFVEGKLLRNARGVLFTCEEERRLASRRYFRTKSNDIVVPYGASAPPAASDAQIEAFRASVPALDRPFILFLGRIDSKKGCDILLQAFRHVSEVHENYDLVMAGPDKGGLATRLKASFGRDALSSRVHWPGALYGDAKWGALRSAAAFALPSHQENFGIAVAEALGAAVPVLTTKRVNIWREIDYGGAGICGEDSVESFGRVLQEFSALSEAGRSAMSSRARALFTRLYDIRNAAPQLLEILTEDLRARGEPN